MQVFELTNVLDDNHLKQYRAHPLRRRCILALHRGAHSGGFNGLWSDHK